MKFPTLSASLWPSARQLSIQDEKLRSLRTLRSEVSWQIPRLAFEELDKVRGVIITETERYLLYHHIRKTKQSLRLKYYALIDNG